MWHNGRLRRRVDPDASWQLARQEHAAVLAERDWLRWELSQTKKSLHETLAALRELQDAVLARQKAEAHLRELYRERDIQRAERAERDPAAPLQ